MEGLHGGRGRTGALLVMLVGLVALIVFASVGSTAEEPRSLGAWAARFCSSWVSLRGKAYEIDELRLSPLTPAEAMSERAAFLASLDELRRIAETGAHAGFPDVANGSTIAYLFESYFRVSVDAIANARGIAVRLPDADPATFTKHAYEAAAFIEGINSGFVRGDTKPFRLVGESWDRAYAIDRKGGRKVYQAFADNGDCVSAGGFGA